MKNNIEIEQITSDRWDQNTYLVWDDATKNGILIDCGDDSKKIINAIESKKIILKSILLTHYHFDHVASVFEIANHFNVKAYIHKHDYEFLLDKEKFILSPEAVNINITPEHFVTFDNNLELGGIKIQIQNLPGHSKGSTLFFINDNIFTGDTLFESSVGRWDLPGGNPRETIKSINWMLDNIKKDAMIYPGHGRFLSFQEVLLLNEYMHKRSASN